MKRYLIAILLAGCTDKADIGMSNQPVKCQSSAAGAVNGSVTNTFTNKTYSFGAVDASLSQASAAMAVALADPSLSLSLQFDCGQPAVGTYDPAGGQLGCPFSVFATVSGNLQQVYGMAHAGDVIVDDATTCIAGRFDLTYENSAGTSDGTTGELAGWFSVPLQ